MFPSLGFLRLSQVALPITLKIPRQNKKVLLGNQYILLPIYILYFHTFPQCKNRSRADFVIVTASMGEVGISLCSSLVILPKNCPYSFFVSPVKWDGIAGGKRTLVG